MAWSIRCTFNRIHTYPQAVRAWEKAVIFSKDNPRFPRGLVDKRKKRLSIERTEAEDIVLRLYDFPVVTWHKDHSLTICSEASKSTGLFANHCTPAEMFVTGGEQFRVTVDGRTYNVGKQTTFRPRDDTWKPDQITPWTVRVVNRERAKQALTEVGYKEFRPWLIVYMQMASRSTQEIYGERGTEVVDLLRNRKWRELVARYPVSASADYVLSEVRQAIYREYNCVDRKSVSFLG